MGVPGHPGRRGRSPRTYPAGSSRAGGAARRIMPLAARGQRTEGFRRRAARAAMPLAPACLWRWPSGRARAGAAAAARRVGKPTPPPRSGRSLPATSCIGASGSFRKRLALVVKGFFVKSLSAAARGPEPSWGTRKPGRPRPRGRASRRAVLGRGAGSGRPTAGCCLRGLRLRPGGSRRARREI